MRNLNWLRLYRLPAICLTFSACTSLLGIDEDYVLEASNRTQSSGGISAAPEATTGGAPGGVGGQLSGGSWNTGGSDAGHADAVAPDTDSGLPDGDARLECRPAAACLQGQKCCFDTCVDQSPFYGCATPSCDPCPEPPANAVPLCTAAGQCTVECKPGYQLNAGECQLIAPPDGGSGGMEGDGGTGGSGGAGPSCDESSCPNCFPLGFPCCPVDSDRCGCSWAPRAYCYPS